MKNKGGSIQIKDYNLLKTQYINFINNITLLQQRNLPFMCAMFIFVKNYFVATKKEAMRSPRPYGDIRAIKQHLEIYNDSTSLSESNHNTGEVNINYQWKI